MNLHYEAIKLKDGYNPIVTQRNSPLKLLEFGEIYLKSPGTEYHGQTGKNEEVLDIFSGRVDISVRHNSLADGDEESWAGIGDRNDVFSGPPAMVYLPRNAKYRIHSVSGPVHIGVFKSPARRQTKATLVLPGTVDTKMVGKHNWQRRVTTPIGGNIDADRLIVGETVNPTGNWSGYPPHKHDVKKGNEAPYEEVYFFMVKPSKGFGVQIIYTSKNDRNPLNEIYMLRDGDAVAIPRGYHPVAAGAGYQLAYFWGLAGNERKYAAWSDDPDHAWIRDCEAIIK